jgi:hypothetical protein
MLGAIDLTQLMYYPCPNYEHTIMCPQTGSYECCKRCDYTGISNELGIDWVIVGGESGSNARPMHPDWARSIRDQCQAAGVPFLFKQWGEWAIHQKPQGYYKPIGEFAEWWTINPNRWHFTDSPNGLNLEMKKVGKKAAGRTLDGVTHDEYPEVKR